MFPVPSNSELHIQLPTTVELEKVEIFNSLGQLVSTHQTRDMDVSMLSSGMHWAKISTSEGVFHKNFIKK